MSEENFAEGAGSQAATEGQGNGGENNQDDQGNAFIESLPEDLRGHEGFKDIPDVGTLAARYIELIKGMPKIPEKPEEYDIPLPADLPKDEKFISEFKAAAHQAKLTAEQAKSLAEWWNDGVKRIKEQQDELREKMRKSLKDEWKGDFEKKLETARKALKTFGSEELVAFLDQTGLGDNPLLVKAFTAIGDAISEDSLVLGKRKPETIRRTLGGEPLLTFPSMEKTG